MKIFVFIVILSYVAFEKVSGRKCYVCASKDSFGKCDDERKEMDCSLPGVTDFSCLKYSYKLKGVTFYARSCSPTNVCNSEALCNNKENCKIYCCNSDLCNKGAAVQLISGILLFTSVMFGLFGI